MLSCYDMVLVQDEVTMLKKESEMPFDDLLSQLPKDLIANIDKPFDAAETLSEVMFSMCKMFGC